MVLNQLYKHTQLQTSFSIILARARPRQAADAVDPRHARSPTVDHRVEVIRRRTQYLLERAEARAHIVEGLRIALTNIDEVIDIIKKAPDVPTAKDRLIARFGLSDIQADAILDMRLARLTGPRAGEARGGVPRADAAHRGLQGDPRRRKPRPRHHPRGPPRDEGALRATRGARRSWATYRTSISRTSSPRRTSPSSSRTRATSSACR